MTLAADLEATGAQVQQVTLLDTYTGNSVGNVALTLTTLHTYTLPGGSMAEDGDSLEFEYRGATALGSTTVQIVVTFGSTAIMTTSDAAPSSGTWVIRGRAVRSSETLQRCGGECHSDVSGIAQIVGTVQGSDDLTTDLDMKIEATGVAEDDVTLEMARLTLFQARP